MPWRDPSLLLGDNPIPPVGTNVPTTHSFPRKEDRTSGPGASCSGSRREPAKLQRTVEHARWTSEPGIRVLLEQERKDEIRRKEVKVG